MSFVRLHVARGLTRPILTAPHSHNYIRNFAKRRSKHESDEAVGSETGRDHNRFVPTSQNAFGETYQTERKDADDRMTASVNWFKAQATAVETRSSGRVTPDILDGIRVNLGQEGMESVKLVDIATVGVKNGNTIVVTVFDQENLKHTEKAIYAARLPGLTPQRTDSRTILLPVAQPTTDVRDALVRNLAKQAEDTRAAIRKTHQAAQKKLKGLGYDGKGGAIQDLQALVNKHIEQIEKILEGLRKGTR